MSWLGVSCADDAGSLTRHKQRQAEGGLLPLLLAGAAVPLLWPRAVEEHGGLLLSCAHTLPCAAAAFCRRAELTDVFDVYLEATGLLHEAECAQDEEEEEELRQQGVVVTRRDASKRGVAEGQRVGRSACWRPISRQVAQQQEQADEGQQ